MIEVQLTELFQLLLFLISLVQYMQLVHATADLPSREFLITYRTDGWLCGAAGEKNWIPTTYSTDPVTLTVVILKAENKM